MDTYLGVGLTLYPWGGVAKWAFGAVGLVLLLLEWGVGDVSNVMPFLGC